MLSSTEEYLTDPEIREARDILWEAGILHWKLDGCQKKLYDFYMGNLNKTIVVNASRRLGKSYFLITIALEMCIQKPGTIIKYIQPTREMIRDNLNPDFELMLEDCPLHIRPQWKGQGNVWIFPNGSRINVAGTDGKNYNKLRGGNADLCIVDEAGFCSDLKHIINSILIPLTTITKGRIILSSTTPTEPDHEFNEYMDYAEMNENLIRKTIYDAIEDQKNDLKPRLTNEIIDGIIAAIPGGVASDAFRCEYLCIKISNSDSSVLPEFTAEVQKDCVVEWPRPLFCDRYTAMDIGFVDLNFVIFAYWDYDNAVLVIEDEIVMNGPSSTTKILAEEIKKKEKELWTNRITKEFQSPYMRVSDNNLIVINDMAMDHGLYFQATEKHDKLTYMSHLREMIRSRQIVINPRCKRLITHMKGASWDKQKKDFKRSPDNGHYDGVAALLYLSRNIDKTRNPYPAGYRYSQLGPSHNVFIREQEIKPQDSEKRMAEIKKMFGERKSSFSRKK